MGRVLPQLVATPRDQGDALCGGSTDALVRLSEE